MPPFDDAGYPLNPYDEVVPGLFQSDSTWSPLQLFGQGFDAVFDLIGYDRGDGCSDLAYVCHPIDDVPWIGDEEAIHDLGRSVAALVRSHERVLVNCMSGLNRSGLLVGRALIELGHTPREAIEAVRAARGPRALSDRAFARFLLVECAPAVPGLEAREPNDDQAARADREAPPSPRPQEEPMGRAMRSPTAYTDYVEIIPGLFLGSHPEDSDAFVHGPAAVVCLSRRPSSVGAPDDHLYVQWAIKDGPVPDTGQLRALCELIRSWLDTGRSVFVHCDAGLNRSALIATAVLVNGGMAPEAAIARVRERRDGSLGETYAAFITASASELETSSSRGPR